MKRCEGGVIGRRRLCESPGMEGDGRGRTGVKPTTPWLGKQENSKHINEGHELRNKCKFSGA